MIIDNARFHHRSDVVAKLAESHIILKFLLPYSPQLNPIEEFFSMLKARYNAINPYAKTRKEMKSRVSIILKEYLEPLTGFYNHARSFLALAEARHHFI